MAATTKHLLLRVFGDEDFIAWAILTMTPDRLDQLQTRNALLNEAYRSDRDVLELEFGDDDVFYHGPNLAEELPDEIIEAAEDNGWAILPDDPAIETLTERVEYSRLCIAMGGWVHWTTRGRDCDAPCETHSLSLYDIWRVVVWADLLAGRRRGPRPSS